MAEEFTFEARVAAWVRFEAELARSQARHGVIPEAAATVIVGLADDLRWLDLDALSEDTRSVGHPVVPFVRAMGGAAGWAGEYLHWGVTSQDVTDTGTMLALSAAADRLDAGVAVPLHRLRELALEHRDDLMVGRTLGQHATPITFGGKVAGWSDPLVRWLRDLRRMRESWFVGQLGGATGQLAVLGPVGYQVREEVCRALGLAAPLVSWNTARDRLRAVMGHVARLAADAGRIAAEIVELQRTEIGEVAEGFGAGQVGSSAMPHKRNPSESSRMVADAAVAQSELGAVQMAWRGSHERDKTQFAVEDEVLARLCTRTHRLVVDLGALLEGLVVDVPRMAQNLAGSGDQAWSEFLLDRAARSAGRATAHEQLHRRFGQRPPGEGLFAAAGYSPLERAAAIDEMSARVRVAGRELVQRAVGAIDDVLEVDDADR